MQKAFFLGAILCGALAAGSANAQSEAGAMEQGTQAVDTTRVEHPAPGVTETTVTKPDGSVVVTRRVTTVIGTELVLRGPLRKGRPNMVSGGVGGAIGGRDILGTTPAYNIPLSYETPQ